MQFLWECAKPQEWSLLLSLSSCMFPSSHYSTGCELIKLLLCTRQNLGDGRQFSPLTFRKATVMCQFKADRNNRQIARSKEEMFTAEDTQRLAGGSDEGVYFNPGFLPSLLLCV